MKAKSLYSMLSGVRQINSESKPKTNKVKPFCPACFICPYKDCITRGFALCDFAKENQNG